MFITVKYGNKKDAYFNINCRMYHLLASISKRCNCENIEFDLADPNGTVKQIQDFKNQYATTILKDREILVLIKVDKSNPALTRYIPLLEDEVTLTEEFLNKLNEDRVGFDMPVRESSIIKSATIAEKQQNLHRFKSNKRISQSPLISRSQLPANSN